MSKIVDRTLTESRILLRRAWEIAMGSYVEQEKTKKAEWRRKTRGEIIDHIWRNAEKLKASATISAQLRNSDYIAAATASD